MEIRVPALGESVTEATVAKWLKKVGENVSRDEPLVELETDKVTLEVNAPADGVISEISADEGANVEVGGLLGSIGSAGSAQSRPAAAPAAAASQNNGPASGPNSGELSTGNQAVPTQGSPQPPAASAPVGDSIRGPAATATEAGVDRSGPAVRKLLDEQNLSGAGIAASGRDGRLTKGDVLFHLEQPRPAAAAPLASPSTPQQARAPREAAPREQRVKMTRLRKRIAERLKDAQNTAAMLTTFNEVDMTNVMALREQYKDRFEKKHGVKLGFMSFFLKASITALKELPAVNGEIDGDDLIYKDHYDIGVAVGTEQGLVVPVVRDADQMSFAQIEKAIGEYGRKARDGKLSIADLSGGTFTISNGGVYGSLMSTPILNPPQSAILGMHKTMKRPVAIGDKVEVRPMMYLALSYDHRIIDGREAVTFLVRVKECIEDPQRLLLDM